MHDMHSEIERLKTEIASLASKLEELSIGQVENGGSHHRDRYESLKRQLRGKWGSAASATRNTGKKVARYAEENPWQIAAAVIALGVLAGIFFKSEAED